MSLIKITELTVSTKLKSQEPKLYEVIFSGLSYQISDDRSSYTLTEHKSPTIRPSKTIRTYEVFLINSGRWVVQYNDTLSGISVRRRFVVLLAGAENPNEVTMIIKRYSTMEPISWSVTKKFTEQETKYRLGHALAEKLAKLNGPETVMVYREATMAFDIGLFIHELKAKEKKEKLVFLEERLALLESKDKIVGQSVLDEEDDWVVVEGNDCSV